MADRPPSFLSAEKRTHDVVLNRRLFSNVMM
jgi:hypothetical protein